MRRIANVRKKKAFGVKLSVPLEIKKEKLK